MDIIIRKSPKGDALAEQVPVSGDVEAREHTRSLAKQAHLDAAYWSEHLPDGSTDSSQGAWERVDA